MSLLDALHKGGHLRTLDHALAQSLRRLERDTPDGVLAAAALASLAVAKGHAGLSLSAPWQLLETDADLPWPGRDAWRAQLAASRWIATPCDAVAASDPHVPLVLGPDGDRLAKRHGAVTLADLAEIGVGPDEVRARLAVSIGLATPGEEVSMTQLLGRFDPDGLPTEPWVLDGRWP